MAGSTGDAVTTARGDGAAPAHRRSLLVLRGDQIDARPLPLRGEVTVGRGSGCAIQIEHPSLSRTHLQLVLTPTALQVIDLDSANGTTVAGIRLVPHRAVATSPNDPIQAGDVTLVIQDLARAAPAERPRVAPAPSGAITAVQREPIVHDAAMRRVYDLAGRLARGRIGILVTGETGAGKDVLAELIHRLSPRASGPLVRVNCAALVDSLVEAELFGHERGAFTGALRERAGLIEAASGGTIFLDEIGEMAAPMQAKLLRVVEENQVMRVGATTPRAIDVRFIAATNRDLEAEVERGAFRRDLYFRIAGAVLALPPLRERPQEIEILARRFIADTAQRLGRAAPKLTAPAMAALRAHPWPGNVRELRNVLERATLLVEGGALDVAALDLPADAPRPAPSAAPAALRSELDELERQRILAALEQHGGNQSRTAAALGMPRRTLISRLERYQVPRPRKR